MGEAASSMDVLVYVGGGRLEVEQRPVPVPEPDGVLNEVARCGICGTDLHLALDQLDRAGTLVVLGTGHPPPRVNHNRMIALELTVLGSYNCDDGGFADALALLASGALPVVDLLDPDDVGPHGVYDAIVATAGGRRRGKVLVDPSPSPSSELR